MPTDPAGERRVVSYACAENNQHKFCDGMIRGLGFLWTCLCRCHTEQATSKD